MSGGPDTVAVATCWPDSVRVGSGTVVAQRNLRNALDSVGVKAELLQTSDFAGSLSGVVRRYLRNRAFGENVRGFGAVLGIDGEGWTWRPPPGVGYVAVCKAVLADVLSFEPQGGGAALRIQAAWEGRSARRAHLVVAASRYSAGQIARYYDVDPAKLRVVPEAFDARTWVAELSDVPRVRQVLAVGHMYARKNYLRLIAAWRELVREDPMARLVIVGRGPQLPSVLRAARNVPRLRVLGQVSRQELLRLYSESRVFCHPSLQENFGYSVLEAVASRLTVVAHPQPAVVENLGNIPGVRFVDCQRSTPLAGALLDALAREDDWPASRADQLERLGFASVGRVWQTVLAELSEAQ